MKIGTFAMKFKLNSSAVRFYIQNGLLTPDIKNGQYEFGPDCVADMEHILKYKSYHFSLEEIQLLFFLEKTSRFQDKLVLEVCSDMLKKKQEELIQARDSLSARIQELASEIEHLPELAAPMDNATGVPFSFIPYLYCPHCQTPLQLDSASLSGGKLHWGQLWCECGYKASICDGIVVCHSATEDTPFKAFENVESVLAMTQQYSSSYRLLIDKANLHMYNKLQKRTQEPTHILVGPFTLNFLLKYIENLGQSATYILADPSKKRIEKLKSYLSAWPYNIVYIAGTPEDWPIKHNTADLYIDDFSTVNCLFTYNRLPAGQLAPFLKSGAQIIGIFASYAQAPKSLANFKQNHPGFSPAKMSMTHLKSQWNEAGVLIVGEKSLGFTSGNDRHFPQHATGEQVELFTYEGKKK